jgi:hypothetical protein
LGGQCDASGMQISEVGGIDVEGSIQTGVLVFWSNCPSATHLRSSHAYNSMPHSGALPCGSKCTPASGSTPSVAVAVKQPQHVLVVVGTHVARGALLRCWINRRLSATPQVFGLPLSRNPAHTMQAHTFGSSSSSSSSALLAINQAAAPGDAAALGTSPVIAGQPLLSQQLPCSIAAHAPTSQLQHRCLLSQPQEKEQQQQQQQGTCLPSPAPGEAAAARLHSPLQAATGEASHPSTPHLARVRSPAWLLSVTTYCACCAGCL